jgi:lipopolysaccharide export LptBFGC system permease protein LptF
MAFSSSRRVPLDGHADTPADFARGAAERPSLAAFHADMMALYLHRKGKDNEALQWYVLLVLSLYVLLVLSMYVLLVLSMYVLLVLSLYVLLVLSMHVLLVLSMHVLLVQSLSSILSYLWPILCFLIAARQLPHVMEAHVNTRLGYMTRPAYIFPSSGYIISSSGSFSLPCP